VAEGPHPPNQTITTISMHRVEDVQEMFSEITFSKTMLSDHSPHNYEAAIDALWNAVVGKK